MLVGVCQTLKAEDKEKQVKLKLPANTIIIPYDHKSHLSPDQNSKLLIPYQYLDTALKNQVKHDQTVPLPVDYAIKNTEFTTSLSMANQLKI